ncbi:hypothetical protein [Terrisporobacter petrolearius]|uniref:hypothetical protein n=1 Tax=Terrisporobacter petrolearius TaxID=1460447 RepID=UPI0031CCB9EF
MRSKCNFHTVGKGRGTKYVVTEIYESHKPVFDGRVNNQGGNNSKTAHLLENIIIYSLVGKQLENGGELEYTKLLLPKNKALVTMQMVNTEYMKRFYKNYDGLDNVIDEHLVEKYFMLNHSKIQQRLQSALNSLSRKLLIHYDEVIQVKVAANDNFEYRKATKNEILTILEVENKIMNKMLGSQYSAIKINKGLIYSKKLYRRFYNNCIKELNNNGYGYIESYCNAYEISTTTHLLQSAIKIYNLEEDVKMIKEDLKRMCNDNVIKDLEKARRKIEDSVNNIVFGYKLGLDTRYIDEHIESIKMFTERIF